MIQNPHPFRAACLVTVVEPALPRLRVTEIAHSFDIVVPFRHILFHAGVRALCDERRAQHLGDCEILVGRRALPHGQPVRLYEGMGLTIDIPPPLLQQEWNQQILNHFQAQVTDTWQEEHDDASLLAHSARPPAVDVPIMDNDDIAQDPAELPPHEDCGNPSSNVSSTSSMSECSEIWRDTLIFTFQELPVLLQLPWHDRQEMLRQMQDALASDYDRIVLIHHVGSAPEDIHHAEQECLVVEMASSPPCSPIMRLILVDIEVYPPNEHQPLIFGRRPVWMPQIANQ